MFFIGVKPGMNTAEMRKLQENDDYFKYPSNYFSDKKQLQLPKKTIVIIWTRHIRQKHAQSKLVAKNNALFLVLPFLEGYLRKAIS